MTSVGAADTERAQSASLGQPLERIGWALFLVMIGGLALFPSGLVPEGTWLAGTGLIMIGLNIARHLKGVRISSFSAVLGTIALAVGSSAMAGVDLPVLPTLLAAIGLQTLYSVLLSRRGTP
jgi:hypothetical protein